MAEFKSVKYPIILRNSSMRFMLTESHPNGRKVLIAGLIRIAADGSTYTDPEELVRKAFEACFVKDAK